jgi:Zn-dependent peptidase ImmA (M78 family)
MQQHMYLESRHLRRIEQKANELLHELKITKPPVPVKEMISKMGLSVISYDLSDDVSGILVIENDKGTIGFNPKNSKVRQRFTLAHELGHFLFHKQSKSEVFIDKDFIVKYRSQKVYTDLEIRHEQEANVFAAALLMPKEMLKAELDKKDYDDLPETEFITAMAKIFDVSIQAMTYRIANANLFFN